MTPLIAILVVAIALVGGAVIALGQRMGAVMGRQFGDELRAHQAEVTVQDGDPRVAPPHAADPAAGTALTVVPSGRADAVRLLQTLAAPILAILRARASGNLEPVKPYVGPTLCQRLEGQATRPAPGRSRAHSATPALPAAQSAPGSRSVGGSWTWSRPDSFRRVKRPGLSTEPAAEGELLWTPPEALTRNAVITRYMQWLRQRRGLAFNSYAELWRWSVTDLEGFWTSIWEFFDVRARAPYQRVLSERRMPGARWFEGAELNYAEHALRRRDDHPAVVFRSESGEARDLTYAELSTQVAAVAVGLRELGVRRGDRVAAYLPNIPETLVAFLATASLGAVWSSCSPDFGTQAVVDRFQQIEPRLLFAVDGYRYNGKAFDRMETVRQIQAQLPSLAATVIVPRLQDRPDTTRIDRAQLWPDLLAQRGDLRFEPVPFDHPLWILYSSGTTGLPKAIVQGHGGILLEHLKSLGLQMDMQPEDRLFWFTTTGWMMWNLIIGNLLLGSTVVLYDGSPAYPDPDALWRLPKQTGMTYFGTSASYIQSCIKAGLHPGRDADLTGLRALGSTGGPLSPEGFRWIYEEVKPDLWLGSVSGGTDVCTAFVGSSPLLPVFSGEIQCAFLGAKVEAFDEDGQPVVGEVGELVITEPMPSMPLYLWNDPDGRRYRESYFEMFPGVWRHGDWVKVTERRTYIIYGRSDSTLKRGGVRMGTSEFYRAVAEIPEVLDSLVVDLGGLRSPEALLLFVVVKPGAVLDASLKSRINQALRSELSPRHVPDEIWAVPQIPTTLNGKKLEVPIKRILTGTAVDRAVSQGAVANPDALRFFVELAERRATR